MVLRRIVSLCSRREVKGCFRLSVMCLVPCRNVLIHSQEQNDCTMSKEPRPLTGCRTYRNWRMRLVLVICLIGLSTPAVFAVHHQDSYIRGAFARFPMRYSGEGPTPASRVALRTIEQWERQGISGRFETMGIAMQQLAEDYPELIQRMKQMRIPVTRYGGVGHQEPAPVGRMKDLSGMTLGESIAAQWEAETRTLVPNWHFEDGKIVLGNPRAGEPMTFDELPLYSIPQRWDRLLGGTLAVEYVLGVMPMDFFESTYENLLRDEIPTAWPITAVKTALGMGSYQISYNPGHPLPRPMPGAALLLDDLTFPDPRARPDPLRHQWKPENSPLAFFKRTYGASSFKEMLEMPCPVEYILSLMSEEEKEQQRRMLAHLGELKKRAEASDWRNWQARLLSTEDLRGNPEHLQPLWAPNQRAIPDSLKPRRKDLSKQVVTAAADFLVGLWDEADTATAPAQIPQYVEGEGTNLSVAEAFQAIVFSLEHYAIKERLPEHVVCLEMLGPVEYSDASGQPAALSEKVSAVNPVNIFHAAWRVASSIRSEGRIPALVEIHLPLARVQGRPRDVKSVVNAAEFLGGMARTYRSIVREGMPRPAELLPMGMLPQTAGAPSRWRLHAAWSFTPDGETAHLERSQKTLDKSKIVEAATYLVSHYPRAYHDGNPGGPPDFVPVGSGGVSLAETFFALAVSLDEYQRSGAVPGNVTVTGILGPVDYPMYELPEEPKFDPAKRIGGWQPFELKREYFPASDLVSSQGLSGGPRFDLFEGTATGEVVIAAATQVVKDMREQGSVPSQIAVAITPGGGRPPGRRPAPLRRAASTLTVNPAELLYPMALEYLTIETKGRPEPVHVSSKKIIEDQVVRSVTVSTPVRFFGGRLGSDMTRYDTFLWRSKVSRWLLNRAWTYTPSVNRKVPLSDRE